VIPLCDAEKGTLPPGIFEATWGEIVGRYGSTPPRLRLLAALKSALDSLRQAGCARAYLEFFQRDRNSGEPKGIVAINLGELP